MYEIPYLLFQKKSTQKSSIFHFEHLSSKKTKNHVSFFFARNMFYETLKKEPEVHFHRNFFCVKGIFNSASFLACNKIAKSTKYTRRGLFWLMCHLGYFSYSYIRVHDFILYLNFFSVSSVIH